MSRKLGNMETAQALSNQVYSFNTVICLQLVNGPPVDRLRQVLDFLQCRHPLLGVHLKELKENYFFEAEGTPPIPISQVERRDADHWREIVEAELDRRFDLFTGPLCRVTVLSTAGTKTHGESELILTIQHSIIDAVSGAALVQEMMSLFEKLEKKGTSLGQPEPMQILPAAESLFPSPFRGLRCQRYSFLFMMRQMIGEFRYRMQLKCKQQPPIHAAGKCKILSMKLSRETTAALLKESRWRRITLNSLLITAMLKAVRKYLYKNEERPLRCICTADLRPYLKPAPTADYLGSYFAMLMYTVDMKEGSGFWEIAKAVNDKSYASLKRGDKFLANLMSLQMMQMLFRLKSFRMSTVAVSVTPPLVLAKAFGKIEVRDVHAFVSNFVLGPEYTALSRLYDNCLRWDFLYLDSDMDEKLARTIAGEIIAILEALVKNDNG